MIRRFAPLVLLFSFAAAMPADRACAAEQVFRAGAAASNITPPIGTEIIGGFNPAPSTHVHDELHARTLVLDDGTAQLAIVVCDLLGVGRDLCAIAAERIEKECGIPRAHVLIAGTHTHSAASALGGDRMNWERPELDEYQRFVVGRIVDGVRRAQNLREPAQIAWGATDEPRHVFNRRWHLKPGTMPVNPFGNTTDVVKMNPGRGPHLVKPAGPVDPQVWTLCVRAKNGTRTIGLLSNYSLHYVGGVGAGHISADYFGVFARRIVEMLDAERQEPPLVALLSNGTSGDVNNNNLAGPSERLAPYEKMRIVADDVARAALASLKAATWHDWVPLAAVRREPIIGSRPLTKEQIERARGVLSWPADPAKPASLERIYADRVVRLSRWPAEVPVPLQALRIGDLAIGALPCETFAETGLELKAKSPIQAYFTIELANGYYGYLPTPPQHKLGGYETWPGTNRLEVEASVKLTAQLLEMLDELAKSKPAAGE